MNPISVTDIVDISDSIFKAFPAVLALADAVGIGAVGTGNDILIVVVDQHLGLQIGLVCPVRDRVVIRVLRIRICYLPVPLIKNRYIRGLRVRVELQIVIFRYELIALN